MNANPNLMLELGVIHERFRSLLQNVLGNDHRVVNIASRVKSLESIREKLARIDSADVRTIQDLVGFKIVVRQTDDVSYVVNVLRSNFAIDVCFTPESPFDRVHLVLKLGAARESLPEWEMYGDIHAEVQVVTEISEAWSQLQHALHYKVGDPTDAIANVATQPLDETIARFERLLDKPDVHEKNDVHPVIKKHDFLLHPNPAEVLSEVPIGLGTEYRIDFLIRESDGSYILVEIENPKHRIFTQQGDFTAAVNHAQRQVEDWQEWIEDNLPTVQRTYPDMSSPRGLVVIGRSGSMSDAERKRLRRRNINMRGRLTIWTYDDLLNNAKASVSAIRNILGTHT